MNKQEIYIVDGYNPIINAAKPLLSLTNAMKKNESSLSVIDLIYRFSKLIEEFEKKVSSSYISLEDIKEAKYCLCSFVDEMAVRAKWANEEWSKKSLLVTFFDEAWGGEGFFTILENAKKDADNKLYLLEFIYLCLQFGYKGQYQIVDSGDIIIDKYKNSISKIITKNRQNNLLYDLFVTSIEQDIKEKKKTWRDVPVGIIIILLIILLGSIFMYLDWHLSKQSSRVISNVNSLTLPTPPSYKISTEVNSIKIKPLLIDRINSKIITVNDQDDKSIITILGDGLFESGSKSVRNEYIPIIAIIGQELNNIPGRIVVSGYTDDKPISSIEYPSNWHLSQARADRVKQILIDEKNKYIKDQSRVRSEGFGENNPSYPNNTADNRAKNRRVEITVYYDGSYS